MSARQKARRGVPRHHDAGRRRRRCRHRVVRVQALRPQLLGRRGGHRPRLRPGAGGPRLRHRADLGLPRQPGGHAGLHRLGAHEARSRASPTSWPSSPAASPAPTSSTGCSPPRPSTTRVDPGSRARTATARQSHLFVSQWGAFLIEVVLTAVFVLVVLFATHKAAIQGAAGVAIGFGLVIVHLIGIPLTGHLGEPGPEPRAGPGRRRHGAQPGLALHRRPAGRRASWRRSSTAAGRPLQGRDGRRLAGRSQAAARSARYRRIHGSDRGTRHSSGTASRGSWPPSAPTGGRSSPTSCTCPATRA